MIHFLVEVLSEQDHADKFMRGELYARRLSWFKRLGLVDICLNCDSCSYVIGMINGPGADLGFRSRESGESQSDSARRQPADVTLLTN